MKDGDRKKVERIGLKRKDSEGFHRALVWGRETWKVGRDQRYFRRRKPRNLWIGKMY